ncbi:hypothetical protein ACFY0F_23540 [Streptomyces sp. NPDC001544]|uniref:hypothetical protein n=1 Tax=Streptomyces sp. NPDC001544 TaxID=3364584 RepID=UPI00367DF127
MASFSDDFNRANSTDLGSGWVEVSGDWSIVSQQLSPGAAGGTIILRAAGAMATSDHYAQVTIAATAAVSQGVWCRGNSNISQGYLWRNNGTSWDLFSVVGGSFSVIGTYTAPAAPGDVAKVQAVGTTIKGFVNGVQRVSVTDTNVASGTSVGIRSESSGSIKYDDFSAADITAGASLTLASSTETAQSVTGAKAGSLAPAAAAQDAQPVTGTKTQALATGSALETAQALLGVKTASLGSAAVSETVQSLAGSKTATLGAALEAASAQALAGEKDAPLPAVAETVTAQSFTSAVSRSLDAATTLEAAQPLTGAKASALVPAVEVAGARGLAAAGPDVDIEIAVGAPYGAAYAVGAPEPGRWEVGAPW